MKNLIERLENEHRNSRKTAMDNLVAASRWWVKMFGHETIDLKTDNIAVWELGDATVYLWLGNVSNEWHFLIDHDNSDTELLCPVSESAENQIIYWLENYLDQ